MSCRGRRAALGVLAVAHVWIAGCSGTKAPPAVAGCREPDEDTVALYPFDDREATILRDVASGHDGTMAGSLDHTEGPPGCGSALQLPANGMEMPPPHGRIPDSPDWDLVEGSVDLWLRVPEEPPQEAQGVLSRDAKLQSGAGHLTVFWTPDGTLVTRLQDEDDGGVACSDVVPAGEWVHVGLNFGRGGLEMFVDGRRADESGSTTYAWEGPTGRLRAFCERDTMHGIDGSDNPWVIGASAVFADEGGADSVLHGLAGGAVDHLRISRVRRRFARP